MTLTADLNRLAGTTGLAAQGAANALAQVEQSDALYTDIYTDIYTVESTGYTALALIGALNFAAGTSGLGLRAVLARLSGTTSGPDSALYNANILRAGWHSASQLNCSTVGSAGTFPVGFAASGQMGKN